MQTEQQPSPRARNRKPLSCVPCRSRKKQCDRNIPSCSQCRSRGETHLCRWGDERDICHTPSSQKKPRLQSETGPSPLPHGRAGLSTATSAAAVFYPSPAGSGRPADDREVRGESLSKRRRFAFNLNVIPACPLTETLRGSSQRESALF
jgi:hypothetical protein